MVTIASGESDDRRKSQEFFVRGDMVAATGNFEYAIEMYLKGLTIDPANVDAHQALRQISLIRKAQGGKDLGMVAKMKYGPRRGDDKASMLNAEMLLAYDPLNVDRMRQMMSCARGAGLDEVAEWAEELVRKAQP